MNTADARKLLDYELARSHPKWYLPHVTAQDSRSGDVFKFNVLKPDEYATLGMPERGDEWSWQGPYLDWCIENPFTASLKGRQLGVTWIWAGLIAWDLTFFAGVDDLVYSIKEEDAAEVINRIWDLFVSAPAHFRHGLKVLKPYGDGRPTTRIEVEHRDGRVSTVTGMPATKKAGHSRVARRVLFDEAAHQEYARELWKAIIPAAGDKGGNIGAVSTANGMSDGQGGGNFFHELYSGAGGVDYPNVKSKFLKWDLHPDRDDRWYLNVPLSAQAKAEQYPNDDDEAFLLTGSPFFDLAALKYYSRDAAVPPMYLAEFKTYSNNHTRAKLIKGDTGVIEVYREPKSQKKYGLAADLATGSGLDYSVGAVIDLTDGAPCAELRMKADYVEFTRQLHFLGVWYNNALVMPEKGGGYGDVTIAYLRDGHEGRKPYPRLYRHRAYDDTRREFRDQYGYPMSKPARAKIVSELEEWVNKNHFPWLTRRFRTEARTFVRRDTTPSPRAADGANDDSVIAWGLALEIYSQHGHHIFDRRKKLKPQGGRLTSGLDPRAKAGVT